MKRKGNSRFTKKQVMVKKHGVKAHKMTVYVKKKR